MPNLFLLYFHVCMYVCVCVCVCKSEWILKRRKKGKRKAVVEIILLKYF